MEKNHAESRSVSYDPPILATNEAITTRPSVAVIEYPATRPLVISSIIVNSVNIDPPEDYHEVRCGYTGKVCDTEAGEIP